MGRKENSVTFSAYWSVLGNPKKTAKLGHLKYVERAPPDYFISDHPERHQFSDSLYTSFRDLPSAPYLDNLRGNCLRKRRVFLKFGLEIDSSAFIQLATIWTSKLLLFETVAREGDFDSITWVDCIHRRNFAATMSHQPCSTILITEYGDTFPKYPFGGVVPISDLPKQKLMGGVFRIPTRLLPEVTQAYISTIQRVDRHFEIFDEEIVLSVMNEEYPELFTVLGL